MKKYLENLNFNLLNWDARSQDANNKLIVKNPNNSNRDLEIQIILVRNPVVAACRGRPWINHFRSAFKRRPHANST